MRIKGLMSTAASRAWLGVAIVGFVVVVLVLATSLIPRLSAGQKLVAAAAPAFTEERVDGTRAGVALLSQYVDVLDPLLTARGAGAAESRSLVRLIARELGLSNEQARRILRREAPHTEALTRSLPLEGVAAEIPRLTSYLATTLTVSEDELAATLEQNFPRLAQLLATLPLLADAWYDVPGIQGLTRLSGDKPVRTVPGLRKYLRDDLVPLIVAREDDVRRLGVVGGIGYIPYLLLVVGIALFAYGLLQARRAAVTAPGILSWGIVVGAGVFLLLLVVAAQYSPRLAGGQKVITAFEPVFATDRVKGLSTGLETLRESVVAGDPIMTRRGGAATETAQLYRLVGQRTGRRPGDVRRALMRRVPRTVALLDSLPLTRVAREVPRLVSYLERALRMPRDRLIARMRRRAPGLTTALLAMPDVSAGWRAIPGAAGMTRFDGTPAPTVPAFEGYLRQDLAAVLVQERAHFASFASGSLRLDTITPALLVVCVVLLLYGGMMTQLVVRRQ